MPTVSVNLDTTQYVQVNSGFNPMVLQCHRDSVRITLSAAKPVLGNAVFHLLSGDDAPLKFDSIDTNVWALAITDKSSLIVSETEPVPTAIHDGLGNPISSLSGAIDVHIADVHNVVINQYIHQDTAVASTVAVQTVIGDISFTVVDATGFIIGRPIHINTTTIETTHPTIVNIAGNVITVDRPLDKVHLVGDIVNQVVTNMAQTGQVGTLASPQIYVGEPPPGEVWHITRLLFSMIHGAAGDLGLFGDLAKLTNGVVLRSKVNGQFGTLTNWKNNGDIKTDMFDVEFDPRSGGQGNFGTSGRGSFSRTGAVLRLDGDQGDQFQVLVQDDITALGVFDMKLQGHLEGL